MQVCQFQRLCYKHWLKVESLFEIALSNCGAVEQRDNLRYDSYLPDAVAVSAMISIRVRPCQSWEVVPSGQPSTWGRMDGVRCSSARGALPLLSNDLFAADVILASSANVPIFFQAI